MDSLNSPESSYWYSESSKNPTAVENVKRPFIGIPNDYPNYKINVRNENTEYYLQIDMPANNPFFGRQCAFYIQLTSDISPYGIGLKPDEPAITFRYGYDRLMLPNVDLFTLSVEMPQSPGVAERINNQLKTWTDGFSAENENVELLNDIMKWFTSYWNDDVFAKYTYNLQPAYGLWGDYLSVSYPLQTYDGPAADSPVFETICFDITTGEALDLAKRLPRDIPYSQAMIFDLAVRFDWGQHSQYEYHDYIPAEGSIVTSAWISDHLLSIYLTEPDGRRLQANFWDWDWAKW
jgi:hypothetical protein